MIRSRINQDFDNFNTYGGLYRMADVQELLNLNVKMEYIN